MIAAALPMTDAQRDELARIAGSSKLPHRQVVQARALLLAGDGLANAEIARRSAVDPDTVRRWRVRFVEAGDGGVGRVAQGRGRKPWLPADTVARGVEGQRCGSGWPTPARDAGTCTSPRPAARG
jgi:hypothetical protein